MRRHRVKVAMTIRVRRRARRRTRKRARMGKRITLLILLAKALTKQRHIHPQEARRKWVQMRGIQIVQVNRLINYTKASGGRL